MPQDARVRRVAVALLSLAALAALAWLLLRPAARDAAPAGPSAPTSAERASSAPVPVASRDARSAVESGLPAPDAGTVRNQVAIRVVSRADGTPIAGATVRSGEQLATTGADGVALWPVPADAARQNEYLEVHSPGFVTSELVLRAWVTAPTVPLPPGVTFRGRLVGLPAGSAPADCSVHVFQVIEDGPDITSNVYEAAELDDTASFLSPAVVPDRDVDVLIKVRGCGRSPTTVHVLGGEQLELAVCGGGEVWGRGESNWVVYAFEERGGESKFMAHQADCQDDGSFCIAGLPLPGIFELVAFTRPRHGPVLEAARSEAFALDANNPRREVELRTELSGATVSVLVVDGAGVPPLDARVSFARASDVVQPPAGREGQWGLEASVDSGGRTTLGPVASGTWRVFVTSAGFAGQERRLTLADGAPVELRFVLAPEQLPEARTVTGRVLARDGRPVGGARVELSSDEPDGRWLAAAETDRLGRFVASAVQAERARIVVDFDPSSAEPSPGGCVAFSAKQLIDEELELVLPEPCIVRGRCAAAPRTGSVLVAFDSGTASGAGRAALDDSGRFTASLFPPGGPSDLVVAWPDGRATLKRQVRLELGSVVDLGDLSGAASDLEGVVVDADGQRVAGAYVTLAPRGFGWSWRDTSCDTLGRFKFPNVPPIAGRLSFRADDYSWNDLELACLSTASPLELRLPRRALVALVVRWSGARVGRPRLGVVQIDSQGGTLDFDAGPRLANDGSASLDLSAGDYQFFARFMGSANWIPGPRIRVKSGETQRVEWKID